LSCVLESWSIKAVWEVYICTELVRCLPQWNSCWSISGSRGRSFWWNRDSTLTVSIHSVTFVHTQYIISYAQFGGMVA